LIQVARSGARGKDLLGHQICRPWTIGVSVGWASDRLNRSIKWLMKAVWERLIVCFSWSCLMAIPKANFAGPKSVISHLECSSSLKQAFSSGGFMMLKMSLTCTTKMMVPISVLHQYMHQSLGMCSKPHLVTALSKVWFHMRPACFIPYMLFINLITHPSLPGSSNPFSCSR